MQILKLVGSADLCAGDSATSPVIIADGLQNLRSYVVKHMLRSRHTAGASGCVYSV